MGDKLFGACVRTVTRLDRVDAAPKTHDSGLPKVGFRFGKRCTIPPDNYTRVAGEVLREVRTSQGLTLRDVSKRSGGSLKPTSVAGYERGERGISLERFFQLATLYAVAPHVLLAEVSRRTEEPAVLIDVSDAALSRQAPDGSPSGDGDRSIA